MKKNKIVENTIGISAILVLIVGMGTAFAEEYHLTNSLPKHLEISQNDVIVSYDGKSIGKFSQQVTEENVREYTGIDILEIRLAILETLERILEVLFGK